MDLRVLGRLDERELGLRGVGDTDHEPPAVTTSGAVPCEFVEEAAVLDPMCTDQLEIDEAGQMNLQLGVTPTQLLAQLAASEPHDTAVDLIGRRDPRHRRIKQLEKTAGLWWELIKRLTQNARCEPVRALHIRCGCLDVGHLTPGVRDRAPRPLVLMQQSDRGDQRQILRVIPAGPCAAVSEGELLSHRDHHRQRIQQALSVLMQRHDPLAFLIREQTGQ